MLAICFLAVSSHSSSMACGECRSSFGALWQQSLLHCSGQQGSQWTTPWDLKNHRLHHTGERNNFLLLSSGIYTSFIVKFGMLYIRKLLPCNWEWAVAWARTSMCKTKGIVSFGRACYFCKGHIRRKYVCKNNKSRGSNVRPFCFGVLS